MQHASPDSVAAGWQISLHLRMAEFLKYWQKYFIPFFSSCDYKQLLVFAMKNSWWKAKKKIQCGLSLTIVNLSNIHAKIRYFQHEGYLFKPIANLWYICFILVCVMLPFITWLFFHSAFLIGPCLPYSIHSVE